MVSFLYRLRWQTSRLLQTKVLPKWIPQITLLPGVYSLPYDLTYGDLLLCAPLIFLLFAGYYYTFPSTNAIASGNVASFALLLVFLTASKTNAIFSFVFGIPFERLIGFHNLAACATIVLSILHARAAWKYDGSRHKQAPLAEFPFYDGTNTSGTILTLAMILLVITSLVAFLRRRVYDVWLASHIGLIIGVFVSCIAHSVAGGIIGGIWWLIDCVIRYIVMARNRYPTMAKVRRLDPDVIEIRFPKPDNFNYKPGQFVRVSVAELSALQFHPLSISSAPHEEEVTLHARALGDWTQRLLQLVGKEEGEEESKEIKIWLEGPYGNVGVDLDDDERYPMILCVSGGIGVTHCRSVARHVLHNHQHHGRKLDQLRFVWAVRDLDLVTSLSPFAENSNQSTDSEAAIVDLPAIRSEIYFTYSKRSADVEDQDSRPRDQHFKGRFDLTKILTDMRDTAIAKGVTRIAVFGCGPRGQIDSLKEACRQHSKSLMDKQGVHFDLHVEVFEF